MIGGTAEGEVEVAVGLGVAADLEGGVGDDEGVAVDDESSANSARKALPPRASANPDPPLKATRSTAPATDPRLNGSRPSIGVW